jgi:hypothetical protein
MTEHKGQVGAMSTHDDPTAPHVSKPGEPPPGPKPTETPAPTPGGQKPTSTPGQTTGNP